MTYETHAHEIVQIIYNEGLFDTWVTACRANPRPAIRWAVPTSQKEAAKAIFRRVYQLAGREWPANDHIVAKVRSRLGMQGA